jgi:uncharacterized protein YraI
VLPTATIAPEVQPTQAPAGQILPTDVVPTTAPGPTAQVLLDPGANLHLRQYPNTDALSLGLAPSGTALLVNGRAGAPELPPNVTPTPELTPFVDPVTLLEEGEDLVPAETWLNVSYATPDGGTITAWINALYVGLRDAQGRTMRLADLPTVPFNRAGQATNTAIQPPTAREFPVTVTIVGVDPGVNLHMRRIPSTGGESLALVPNGTVLDFVGITEELDWVLVRYTSPDGGVVRGWISADFATYQRSGQPTDFERLEILGELTILTGEERGGVEVAPSLNITPTATPLRNVIVGTVFNLNEGANLHLRRRANTAGESLALLPNDTQVLVNGQTTDDAGLVWLQVSYEGQDGWVSSEYVLLTFNGRAYNLADVPLIDLTTPTPTETPAA